MILHMLYWEWDCENPQTHRIFSISFYDNVSLLFSNPKKHSQKMNIKAATIKIKDACTHSIFHKVPKNSEETTKV